MRWGQHAGLITDATAARLIALAAADEPAAHEAWQQALELRAALHRLFLAIATRRDPIQPIWTTCGAPMQTRCPARNLGSGG